MGAVARERQQHPARWCLASLWHRTAFKSLGWPLFAAMGLQLPFQEGQCRSQSHLTRTEFVTVEVRVLKSQKSTRRWDRRWDPRTDTKEKHSSMRKCEDREDSRPQTVHFLVLLGGCRSQIHTPDYASVYDHL